jgi:hypothetical protein
MPGTQEANTCSVVAPSTRPIALSASYSGMFAITQKALIDSTQSPITVSSLALSASVNMLRGLRSAKISGYNSQTCGWAASKASGAPEFFKRMIQPAAVQPDVLTGSFR